MATRQSIIGQAALKMTGLPAERLPLVVRFLDLLERLHTPDPQTLSTDDLVTEALSRSDLLAEVPREELMARFRELGEEIRQEAIAKGTAIDGDWTGD